MAILIDRIETLPIEAIILAIIVNELCCHSIYKFAVMFLFEKGRLTARGGSGERNDSLKEEPCAT